MVDAILARGARRSTTFGEADSKRPGLDVSAFSVVNGGTALISVPLVLESLLDVNVARPGMHAKQRPATAHFAMN